MLTQIKARLKPLKNLRKISINPGFPAEITESCLIIPLGASLLLKWGEDIKTRLLPFEMYQIDKVNKRSQSDTAEVSQIFKLSSIDYIEVLIADL